MTFQFTEEYRQSQEYLEWTTQIKNDYPSLPLYLIESAILFHKTQPDYYKKAKDSKKVFVSAPSVSVNTGSKVVEGAITVTDAPIETATVIEEVV